MHGYFKKEQNLNLKSISEAFEPFADDLKNIKPKKGTYKLSFDSKKKEKCRYFSELNLDLIETRAADEENELNTVLLCHGKVIMKINTDFYRPAEVDLLYGDSSETRKAIQWEPKITFKGLVKKMIEWDMKLLK